MSGRFRFGFCWAVLAAVLVLLTLEAVAPITSAAEPQPSARALARVMAVQDRNTQRLMAIQGVVGTATGVNPAGQPVVKVFVAQAGVGGIPANLEGEPVVVQVTGAFFALPKPARPPGKPPSNGDDEIDPTARFDSPVPIGVSTGNEFHCSAGTIGCRVKDALGNVYALSNHHVFDPYHEGVEKGQRVVQPARLDDPADNCYGAATPENLIGKLVGSVAIDFDGGANTVDAAIAIIPTDGLVDPRELGNSTPDDGYGTPKSATVSAIVGQAVQKYGRTTSLTKGSVSDINATVNVGYADGTALFVDQIIVSGRKFIKAGDSGSLLVTDPDKNPVGLVFAGNTRGSMAIANHIDLVLEAFAALGVTIDGE